MKKHVIIVILLLSTVQAVMAQDVALKAGLGLTSISVGDSPYEESKNLIRPSLGMALGVLDPSQSGLFYEVSLDFRGMRYHYDETIVNDSSLTYLIEQDYKVRLTYLSFPIMYRKSLSDDISVNFGISAGLLYGAKRIGTTKITYDYKSTIDVENEVSETGRYSNRSLFPDGIEDKRPLNFLDYGLNLGVTYRLGDFLLSGRYYYGLQDVFKNDYPVKNHSVVNNVNSSFKVICYFMLD